MVVEKGQRFTLRDGMLTLGTGVVTKILPRLTEDQRTEIQEGKKGREKTQAKRKWIWRIMSQIQKFTRKNAPIIKLVVSTVLAITLFPFFFALF